MNYLHNCKLEPQWRIFHLKFHVHGLSKDHTLPCTALLFFFSLEHCTLFYLLHLQQHANTANSFVVYCLQSPQCTSPSNNVYFIVFNLCAGISESFLYRFQTNLYDSFFQGSLFFIIIMIDGSQKHNHYLRCKPQSPHVIERYSNIKKQRRNKTTVV